MKIGINYYIFRLLKENLTYIVGLIILCLFFVLSIIFFNNKYGETKDFIEKSKQDNVKLKAKVDFIQAKNQVQAEGIDIDIMNKFLALLVPESEDFFTIALALEKLSQQTNFFITSYTINLKGSTSNKISLTVNGLGDSTAFLNFLRNYNFGGLRLITIDKISFASQAEQGVTLNASFYNQKAGRLDSSQAKPLTEADKKLLKQIQGKITFDLQPADGLTNFETKTNPF